MNTGRQGATFGIGQLTHVVRHVEGSAIIASAVNAESRRSRPAAGHCVRRQVLLQKLCDAIGLPPVLCVFMVLSVCIGLLGIARSIQKRLCSNEAIGIGLLIDLRPIMST